MAIEKGYTADPYETVTDLRIDGLRLVKVLVPVPIVIGLVAAFEPLLTRGGVFAALLFAVIVLDNTLFEVLVREWARHRGRVDDRRAMEIAGATFVRFWPICLVSELLDLGLPFWQLFVLAIVLIGGVDWIARRTCGGCGPVTMAERIARSTPRARSKDRPSRLEVADRWSRPTKAVARLR